MAKIYGDRWEVIESLGEGGQAHTFLVRDRQAPDGPRRVLKRLKNVPGRLQRFKAEIQALSTLSHPHVLKIVAFDTDSETPYLVTEYCRGGTLTDRLAAIVDDPIAVMQVFAQICDGVAAAHGQSIVHRDIKPDNILFDDSGKAVVADFGICYFEGGERHTLLGEAVGPRNFTAPELEVGPAESVTPLADSYSLGKLLYWMMSNGISVPRERHRDQEFDLIRKRGTDMAHINELLDQLIVEEPQARRGPADIIGKDARRVIRLLRGNYRPIAADVDQLCTFCGRGHYVAARSDSSTAVQNFGFTPVGNAQWKILVCEACGHVQLFRLERAREANKWRGAT